MCQPSESTAQQTAVVSGPTKKVYWWKIIAKNKALGRSIERLVPSEERAKEETKEWAEKGYDVTIEPVPDRPVI